MVLVFFVVNLLRIDLYDVVKEIKKGRDTMKTIIKRSILENGFGFSRQEADHVMKEIQNMDVKTASEFLESQYGYYNAIYAYEDLEIHKGTAEEINHYIERKLSEHSFSWYFAIIFKNPLPAAPILFLHIIYSNMLTMKNDIYYMRPFSIMVRFPGRFFETHVAKMSNINQIILVISSVILVCISHI